MTTPIRIRASSLWELGDCALRWQKRREGLQLPSTPPALIGTAVHASTAAYDQSYLDGTGLTIDDTAGIAVDALSNPNEDVDWAGVKKDKSINTAIKVHTT